MDCHRDMPTQYRPEKAVDDIAPIRPEGEEREQLAHYFVSAPPPDRQTPQEREIYRRALRRLHEVDSAAVIRAAGTRRPLYYGDLSGLTSAVLEACRRAAESLGLPLGVYPPLPAEPLYAAFEPRLVQMACIGLMRAACRENQGPVTASAYVRHQFLAIAVTSERPPREEQAIAIAQETARLHMGSLAVAGGTAAFSLRTNLVSTAGVTACPTAADLLRDGLSCVQTGFYSFFPFSD